MLSSQQIRHLERHSCQGMSTTAAGFRAGRKDPDARIAAGSVLVLQPISRQDAAAPLPSGSAATAHSSAILLGAGRWLLQQN